MTDKQLIDLLRQTERINKRDLRALAKLKLKIEDALAAQRLGHEHKWDAVQCQIEKVDDLMDCEFLATNT